MGIVALLALTAAGCQKTREIYIESDLLPVDGFSQIEMTSVAVLNFDASSIRRKGVDNIVLRDAVAYDLAKALYQSGKVRVIQGEAVQTVQERETVETSKGDFDAAKTVVERVVSYKYNPYQKVEVVLSGRILDYRPNPSDPGRSYIEIMIRLVDNVDGAIYWLTKLRGYYKDVIYTIAQTLSNKTYTEPMSVSAVSAPVGQ